MFDLDAIEKDWLDNSFCLTDEEIRKIYIAEGVSKKAYANSIDEWEKNKPKFKEKVDSDIVLLWRVFDETEKLERYYKKVGKHQRLSKEYYDKSYPKRPYLSHESQIKVVEGSMDIVFKTVRDWSTYYEKFPIEDLYYAALEGLFAATKYCLHYDTKNSFRAYAKSYIYIQLIKCIARKEHISYRNAYCIYSSGFEGNSEHAKENRAKYTVQEFSFDYDKEEPYKPSSIHYMRKDIPYDIDYTKELSSEEFMKDYFEALDDLSEDEAKIMRLSYDINGNPGLTYSEISDFYGYEKSKVNTLKRSARKKLRLDERISKYRY